MKQIKKITINNQEVDVSEIMELIHKNKKLEAIKALKAQIDIGLKDAKDLVDNMSSGNYATNIMNNNGATNQRGQPLNTNRKADASDSVFIKERPTNIKFYIALIIIAALVGYILYYKMLI
ncbi:ribosomal protein L7/L12 [Pedobacter nototheniae]|uniref:ribosomal protein L7/L12 n=1 Tax=Pedobacter nototheniae TaxID=2488994 RepID=UPI00292E67E9|nr:ribosomal protein L7/L12 [Pedobacter nototheniae]